MSFSGGKDSTVLLDIVRNIYPDVPAVFCDTGLEYPELRQFVHTFENVEILRPKYSFREVIAKYGYPVVSKEVAQRIYDLRHYNINPERRRRLLSPSISPWCAVPLKHQYLLAAPFEVSDRCCDVMKKRPFKAYEKQTGRHPIIGTMATESAIRMQKWFREGCNAFESKRPRSSPLSFWTEQDILQYIKQKQLPYASVYGEIVETTGEVEDILGNKLPLLTTTGCNRTGCMFCMFGAHRKGDDRFIRMKETHPQIYAYCMKPWEQGGLGLDEVLTYMKIEH